MTGQEIGEAFEDITKLALIAGFLFIALQLYLRRRRPSWSELFARHRIRVLVAIALAVLGIKIFEDVLGKESGPIDEALLDVIHAHVPIALTGFFSAVTVTGSFSFLFPATATVSITLFLLRRRLDALLVAASTAGGAVLIYVLKLAVGRARPSLWETEDYWGSSFPSGHTLGTAAFATALALVASRLSPRYRHAVGAAAAMWVLLVGFSRLVLGVHWPSDVLVAACLGTLVPLLISFTADGRDDELRHRSRDGTN